MAMFNAPTSIISITQFWLSKPEYPTGDLYPPGDLYPLHPCSIKYRPVAVYSPRAPPVFHNGNGTPTRLINAIKKNGASAKRKVVRLARARLFRLDSVLKFP